MKDIEDLVAGFRRFRTMYFDERPDLFERLTRVGQSPRVMVVACCDSRVDPAIITDSDPGDLFVVRNVANLVPPWEESGHYHGTSAALEFAVRCLSVRHVIVLGHAQCGGIRALLGDIRWEGEAGRFVEPWMSIAEEARREAIAAHPAVPRETLMRECELGAIRVSLRNLASFDFVRRAVEAGRLKLHGWYFDLQQGELLRYDGATGAFTLLAGAGGVQTSAPSAASPNEAR